MGGGLLFLGRSESIHHSEAQFNPLDRGAHLFQRAPGLAGTPDLHGDRETTIRHRPRTLPMSLVVDEAGDVLLLKGDLGELMRLPEGRPQTQLPGLLRRELRPEVARLINRARALDASQPVLGRWRVNRALSSRWAIRQSVQPLHAGQGASRLLVCFERRPLEELKLPVQASNEELTTINEELQIKSQEWQAVNAELEGIYATVDMPLLAFNELALLSRTNRAVQRQLGIDDGWVGRHFAALPWPAGMPGIHALFDLVQASGRTEVMQLDDVGARDWMMRLMPHRGADLAPDGVLMLLEETTQLKLSQRAAMRSNAQLQQLMERSPQLVCICDPAGRLQMANPVFERFHAIAPGGAACRHQCAACRRRHGPHQEQSPGQHDPRDPYADERGAGPVAHDAQGRPPAAGAREADQGLRGRPGAYQHPG